VTLFSLAQHVPLALSEPRGGPILQVAWLLGTAAPTPYLFIDLLRSALKGDGRVSPLTTALDTPNGRQPLARVVVDIRIEPP
jgi:hypothetical protein